MKEFLIALQFLTVLPVKIKQEIEEKDYGKSLVYFPVIGLIIGLLVVLILFLFGFMPHLVTVALALIALIVITGGIHLDGFADTCDGFYGHRPKEKILKIMRDSHIGAMGVIGIVSVLLLKYTLLISIPSEILWKAVIAMVMFSRWSQSLACRVSKYARKEGKGRQFMQYAGNEEIITGAIVTFILLLLMLRLRGGILFILVAFPVFLFINYSEKKIGGMTGDTIGALSEIAEVSVLFFVSALY